MPRHALFTEGTTGGKHLLVDETVSGGQHAFYGGTDTQHFVTVPTAGAQTGSYSLHTPYPPGDYTLIAFRRETATGTVTRFQQTEDSSATADTGSIAFDAGMGYEIAYIVACETYDADGPFYTAWDDPFDPIWTLRWPA